MEGVRTSVVLLLRVVALMLVVGLPMTSLAQLSSTFYNSPNGSNSCPNFETVARQALQQQLLLDPRVVASLTRLHFHDCFVQGCDASVLLDDTANFTGEKNAGPNANSLRGFSAVDAIKSSVEAICPGVVSCADILALAARDAVNLSGGPSWTVLFGRLDSVTANLTLANNNLPNPNSGVATVTASFANQGLSLTDMVALSGAHTFGNAQCGTIDPRLFNWQSTGLPDPDMNANYTAALIAQCPQNGPTNNTVFLDQATGSGLTFDSSYYSNLQIGKGTLHSDQALLSENGTTTPIVNQFAGNQAAFFSQFAISIVNMGNILPGPNLPAGQVRTNCHFVNS